MTVLPSPHMTTHTLATKVDHSLANMDKLLLSFIRIHLTLNYSTYV